MLKRTIIFGSAVLVTLAYPVSIALAQTTSGGTSGSSGGGILSWLGSAVSNTLNIGAVAVSSVVSLVIFIINSIIAVFAKLFILLAISFVEVAINLNQTITSSGSIASYGWGQTLGLANILIVISIIVIAIGTMLRRSWGGLEFLPRVVIIAMVINFSYYVATLLVNISNSITLTFLNTAYGSLTWDSFANFFTNWNPSLSLSGASGAALTSNALAGAFSPLFAIIFTFIAFLAIMAVAIGFFVRYVMITILLMLLPLALVGSLFHLDINNSDVWQKWMNEFIKWVIFGPIMTFFIFLAFAVLSHPPNVSFGIASGEVDIVNYIVVIAILIAGIKVGSDMGIAGAGLAEKAYGAAGAWATKRGKQIGTRVLTAPLRSESGKQRTAAMQNAPLWTGVPALGYALNKFGAMGEKLADEGKFKNLSGDRLAQALPALTGQDRIAAVSKLVKDGNWSKVKDRDKYLTEGFKADYLSYGKSFGDVEKASGMSLEAYSALKEKPTIESEKAFREKFPPGTPQPNADEVKQFYAERADSEQLKFVAGLGEKGWPKMPLSSIYSNYDEKKPYMNMSREEFNRYRDLTTKSVLKNNRGDLNKIAPKMQTADQFKNLTNSVLGSSMPSLKIVNPSTNEIDTTVTDKLRDAQYKKLVDKQAAILKIAQQRGDSAAAIERLKATHVKQLEDKKSEAPVRTAITELKERDPDTHKVFSRTFASRELGIDAAEVEAEDAGGGDEEEEEE